MKRNLVRVVAISSSSFLRAVVAAASTKAAAQHSLQPVGREGPTSLSGQSTLRSLCLSNVRMLDTSTEAGSDSSFVPFFCPKTVSGNQLSDIPCSSTILTC